MSPVLIPPSAQWQDRLTSVGAMGELYLIDSGGRVTFSDTGPSVYTLEASGSRLAFGDGTAAGTSALMGGRGYFYGT